MLKHSTVDYWLAKSPSGPFGSSRVGAMFLYGFRVSYTYQSVVLKEWMLLPTHMLLRRGEGEWYYALIEFLYVEAQA